MKRVLVAGVCVTATFFLGYAFWPASAEKPTDSSTVRLGGAEIVVSVVNTPELRAKGLSGRSGLQENEGMLFVFSESGAHGIWMKDMLFSIDAVWISEEMRVVHLEENLTPESYPKAFIPQASARYLLELPAGFIKAHDIGIGSQLEL